MKTKKTHKNEKEKEDRNKYLIDDLLENFKPLLHMRDIRNKDAFFLLHQNFGHLKEVAMTREINRFSPTRLDEKLRNYYQNSLLISLKH